MTPPVILDLDLLVLDLDGTIRGCKAAKWRPPNYVGEQFLFEGIAMHLANYCRAGVTVRFATNQGGIGAGHFTDTDCQAVLYETIDLLNKEIGSDYFAPEDIEYCPSNDEDHPDRKPNPGMLNKIAEQEGMDKMSDNCLYVGDRESDRLAARAAGYAFMWAWDFHPGVPVRPENKR